MRVIRNFFTGVGASARPPRTAAGTASTALVEAGPAVSTEEADRLRDAGQYALAAGAYRAILGLAPQRTEIWVQYGNMLKDSGRLEEAEAAYRAALLQMPDDADTYLQLGHALKLQRRRAAAVDAYRRAAELAPLAPEPRRELVLLGGCPIVTVDTGSGSPLAMLSIGDDVIAEKYRAAGARAFAPASLMLWFHLARQSRYAIDIGAFTGIYALVAADANPLITVAALEASKQNFSRLCVNIQINRLQTQIAPLNFAAGDRPGDCQLNHYGDAYSLDCGATLLERGHRPFSYSETAGLLPLDDLPAMAARDRHITAIELPATGPDIVKIGAQGLELAVLAGLPQTIQNSSPIFIVACRSPYALWAVHACLAEFSYAALLIDDKNISLIDDLDEYSAQTIRNVLFYPRSKETIIKRAQNDSGLTTRP
jgi:FkbM family methyltransferase